MRVSAKVVDFTVANADARDRAIYGPLFRTECHSWLTATLISS